MKIIKLGEKKYKKAVEETIAFLKKGETIVIPTDTIYGLACDALNEKAVEKLLKIKKRDRQKGLPIFVNSIEMARRLAYIDKKKEEFLRKIWLAPLEAKEGVSVDNSERRKPTSPHDTANTNGSAGLLTGPGKITVVLCAKDIVPRLTTGGRDTVALRMPDYKFILDLITAYGRPITGTSANISGNEPIRSAKEAATQWKDKKIKPALIIDDSDIESYETDPRATAKRFSPSTIIDITGHSPIILRSGIITKKELENLFNANY